MLLQKSIAAEIDRVILEGSGSSNEPLGIVNTPDINTQSSVGTPSTYSDVTTAIAAVLANNYPGELSSLSWTMNPYVAKVYDGLVTGITNDNTPLEPTPWVRELRKFYTSNHKASGGEYNSIVGDFSQVLLGTRYNGVLVDRLPAGTVTDANSETFNATSEFLWFLRARARVDVCIMQPSWFSVLSGVTIT